jgi:sugar lactone lactonase YvrE
MATTIRTGGFMFAVCLALAVSGCNTAQLSAGMQPDIAASDAGGQKRPQRIYVSNIQQGGRHFTSSINVYSAKYFGNVAPIQTIVGPHTDLKAINGIVVSRSGEIYVADSTQRRIIGFSKDAQGDVPPNVSIHGYHAHLFWPIGLAIDAQDNLYVGDCGTSCVGKALSPSILEFAAGSNGDVAPIRQIRGANTELRHPNGIALDEAGNMYVTNIGQESTVEEFSADANGEAEPLHIITGRKSKVNEPLGIAVNGNGIYVDSGTGNYIERFPFGSHGHIRPAAKISGGKTFLMGPDGVALDAWSFVYAAGGQRILKFEALAHGDAKPIGEIAGSLTNLHEPTFLYVK